MHRRPVKVDGPARSLQESDGRTLMHPALYRLSPVCGRHYTHLCASLDSFDRLGLNWTMNQIWLLDTPSDPVNILSEHERFRKVIVEQPVLPGNEFLWNAQSIESEIRFFDRFCFANQGEVDNPMARVILMDSDTYFGSSWPLRNSFEGGMELLCTGIEEPQGLHLSGGASIWTFKAFHRFTQWAMVQVERGRISPENYSPFARDVVFGRISSAAGVKPVVLPHDVWYTGSTYGQLAEFLERNGQGWGYPHFYHVHVGDRHDKGEAMLKTAVWSREPEGMGILKLPKPNEETC